MKKRQTGDFLCFEADTEEWGQSWEGSQGNVCRESCGHPRSLG